MVCQECGEQFSRPSWESASRFARRKFCSPACASRAARVLVCVPCGECGVLMRPINGRAADYPGTITRVNAQCCFRCYVPPPQVVGVPDPLTVAGLVRLLADRRRRGVPAEGVLMEGEAPNKCLEDLTSY